MIKSTWFNILMLIIFPPFGILLMFLFAKWPLIVKIIVAVLMTTYTIELLNFFINILSKFN